MTNSPLPSVPRTVSAVLATAWIAVLPACDDCNGARVSGPTRVVVSAPSGAASATASGAVQSAPVAAEPARPLPAALHGKIAYQRTEDGAPRLLVAELDANGVSSPRRVVADLGEGAASIVFGRDAASLVYARLDKTDGETRTASLWTVQAGGAGNLKLADCEHRCSIAGVAADGRVWYVDHGASMIGTIKTVPQRGGAASAWKGNPPKGWATCALSLALSRDAGRLLIGVDNQLGWPACIDGGLQGLYVVPVDSAASAVGRGPRITCFTKSKEKVNLTLSGLAFDAAGDRIAFSVIDAWAPDASADGMPVRWSCALDGTDARREDASSVWRIEEEQTPSGKRLVAIPPAADASDPIAIVSSMKPEDTWTVWTR